VALSPRISFLCGLVMFTSSRKCTGLLISHRHPLTDHELHYRFRVDDRVERETLQILAWDLRQAELNFRTDFRATVNASHQR
jgi:hypothetical protein